MVDFLKKSGFFLFSNEMNIYLMLSNIDKNILFNIKLKHKVELFFI